MRFGSWNVVVRELNIHVLMRDERRKEESSKQGQTNKAKQHTTSTQNASCSGWTDRPPSCSPPGWLAAESTAVTHTHLKLPIDRKSTTVTHIVVLI